MPLVDFCENNWKSMCACSLTENEHKKRQKVQEEKDEIRDNTEWIGPKIMENNGKSASLKKADISEGINVNWENLTNLRFAKNVALFNQKTKQMEKHLNSLNSDSLKVGLKIHTGMTKYMTNHADTEKVKVLIDQEKNWKTDRIQIPQTNHTPWKHYTWRSLCQDQSSMELLWKKKPKEILQDDLDELMQWSSKWQNDLDELMQWSNKWQLKFHPEKCGTLKLGRERETEYLMNSKDKDGNPIRVKLKEVQAEKDLGVTIDKVLSFKRHVELATSKANRVIGVIRRSFDYLTPAIFVQLFKGLVRPLLEYGHCVWNPDEKNQKGLCAEVEKVQRRATKMLGHLKDLPYPERLRRLKLPCLEHRKKTGDVIEVYKYLHGFYKVSHPDFHIARNVMRSTRGNSLKLLKPRHRLNARGNYFANRVVNLRNSLPDNVVPAPLVDSFKRRLDKHWAAFPSTYDPECLA